MTVGSKNGVAPVVGNGVYIGAGAILIGGIIIGDNAKIGANAIVVKNVNPGAVIVSRASEAVERRFDD